MGSVWYGYFSRGLVNDADGKWVTPDTPFLKEQAANCTSRAAANQARNRRNRERKRVSAQRMWKRAEEQARALLPAGDEPLPEYVAHIHTALVSARGKK